MPLEIERQKLSLNNLQGKKILMVLPTWDPTYLNKNIGKFIKCMLEVGAKITLFFEEPNDNASLSSIPSGVTQYCFKHTQSRFFNAARLLLKEHFDLCWTYAGYRENLILVLKKFIRGDRIIIKSDSKLFYRKQTLRSLLSKYLIFLFPGWMSDLILIESKKLLIEAQTWYSKEKLFYFPNGVPCDEFQKFETEFQNEKSPHAKKFILFTGRYDYEKGIDILIDAFKNIETAVPDFDLIIVGSPWDIEYEQLCKRLIIDKGLSQRIFLQAACFGKDLARWYFFASLYALPSRNEGLPNRLPEAMYFRNPIVACDVGQVASLIGKEEGILVPPGNSNLLALALKETLSNKQKLFEMGEKGREKIIQHFDDAYLFNQLLLKLRSFF